MSSQAVRILPKLPESIRPSTSMIFVARAMVEFVSYVMQLSGRVWEEAESESVIIWGRVEVPGGMAQVKRPLSVLMATT
jgi:hypothetical protein